MSFSDDLRNSHENLVNSIAGLKTEDIECPGAIGGWSIREILLHIAMWDGEVLKMLSVWRVGHEVDWSHIKDHQAILKFNDFWISSMQHLSVEAILKMLESFHDAIIADVSAIPEAELEKRNGLPSWLTEITIEHHKPHIEKIMAYRKSQGI